MGARHGRVVAGSAAATATARHIIERDRTTPAVTCALERLQFAALDTVASELGSQSLVVAWEVLGSFALAEHLARTQPRAPSVAWQPNDIDVFVASDGPQSEALAQVLVARVAVTLWRDLGIFVSLIESTTTTTTPMSRHPLPVRIGVGAVRKVLRAHFDAIAYGRDGLEADCTPIDTDCYRNARAVCNLELLPVQFSEQP